MNNIAEYEAILLGLHKLRTFEVQTCVLTTDSKVVSSQMEKECIAREPTLKKYLAHVRRMENNFEGFTIEHIKRSQNFEADELVKVVAPNTPLATDVFFQVTKVASVKMVKSEPILINVIKEHWHTPIMAYLYHYYEPDNTIEHVRMQQRAKAYQVINNDLYKTSISDPLLRCISMAKGQELLSDIHAGVYVSNIVARALTAKVLQQGFYLPAIIDDSAKLVATCEACQKFSHRSKAPAHPSQLITLSWPLQ
jgi:hypothetical protein